MKTLKSQAKLICASLLLTAGAVFSQDNMKEWADGACFKNALLRPKAKFYKMDFAKVEDDGHGKAPYYPLLKFKKIAIISFSVKDIQRDKHKKISYAHFYTHNETSDGAIEFIADTCYGIATKALKNYGKEQGIEFLTLSDLFKANPSLENTYKNHQIDISGAGEALASLGKKLDNAAGDSKGAKSDGTMCLVDHSRYIDASLLWEDYKFASTVGMLAKALNVDAVIVIQNDIFSDKKGVKFGETGLHIFGANPIAKKDKKYIGFNGAGYNEGQYFMGTVFKNEDGVLVMPANKNGEATGFNIEGYDKLILNAFQDSMNRIKETSEKLTK